jgi:GT2 family glycosyltransferase
VSKKLAIIVVNWNSYELTRDTINSLNATTYKEYDIIVVDNASSDGSAAELKNDFPFIILLQSDSNRGFTGGNNIGMQYALDHGYELQLLLNNDVEVEPSFLEPLIKVFNNKNIGAAQPLIYFHHNHELIWNAGSKYNSLLGITSTPGYNSLDKGQTQKNIQKQIDWITGCAFMIRSNVLQEVGLLTEAFFIYYEDVDLSFKIKRAGYELAYVPSSVIYHIAGMSHKSEQKTKEGFISAKVHYLNARNRIWFLKKYTSLWAWPFVFGYQTFYFFGISFYFIFRRRWQKLKAWNNGIKDGLLQSI